MRALMKSIHHLARDSKAATSIEYGLICAGLAVAIITTLQALGANLVAMLQRLLDFFG